MATMSGTQGLRPSGGAVRPGTPVVAAQQLTKRFRDFWLRDRARAVDGLTFEIQPREIFGLLGPNGSGKSTTIKMILGLLRPTRGRLAVFGRPPSDVEIKKRIGYLPEESYLYGFLNARETLDYYGKLFGLARRDRMRRIDELIDMVGLSGAQFRPVHEYSKGMQRRIGLAQALINDPDFLILDEPTTGLDPLGTRQVKDLIIRLGERGKTVLLSSHLLSDVEDVVDRMIILYGGKKRDEGDCDSLLSKQHRTIIETENLDEQTIAEIDEVIRRRSGHESGILSVSHPRQKLEEKFLDIVNQARAERAETSGATAGAMAGFLSEGAAPLGEDLISQLVNAGEEVPPAAIEGDPSQPPADQAERDGSAVIDSLVAGEPEPTAEPPAAPREPAEQHRAPATDDVDLGVIGSLLDRDDERDGEDDQPEGRRP